MDLTTRCPECGTTFTVTLAQLQLRKGFIRCVSCANIFDGYESVVPSSKQAPPQGSGLAADVATPVEPILPAPSVVRQRRVASSPGHVISEPSAKGVNSSVGSDPDFVISASSPSGASAVEPRFTVKTRVQPAIQEAGPEFDDEPVLSVRRRQTEPDDDTPALYVEPRRPADDLPGFLRQPSGTRRRVASVFWGVMILAGVALALTQLLYVYRAQAAALVPAARPALERFCEPLGCQVPYARQSDHIVIMSSSLRSGSAAIGSSDTGGAATAPKVESPASQVTLNVVLRNTYEQAQQWPTLVLSLTDFSGTLVARKNLPPARYLDAAQLAGPFPAGSEAEITVPLELKSVQINGYQLDKFFQ